jgi:hypothetical protein
MKSMRTQIILYSKCLWISYLTSLVQKSTFFKDPHMNSPEAIRVNIRSAAGEFWKRGVRNLDFFFILT